MIYNDLKNSLFLNESWETWDSDFVQHRCCHLTQIQTDVQFEKMSLRIVQIFLSWQMKL